MDVSIFVKNATLFYFRMEDVENNVRETRKNLKLNLVINECKKCEYCDWHNNCCFCESCGKSSNSNKRKLGEIETIKKKRNNTI